VEVVAVGVDSVVGILVRVAAVEGDFVDLVVVAMLDVSDVCFLLQVRFPTQQTFQAT
jgi:hypothetical protein